MLVLVDSTMPCGPTKRRCLASFAIALSLGIALTGCGSGSSNDPTSTTGQTTKPTTSSREAAIIDGYRQFWTAYEAASDPMNPDDARLAEHATGDELAEVKRNFTARKHAGHVFRGTSDIAPKILTSADAGAVIEDCYFDHGIVYDTKTGDAVSKADTERQLVEATMRLEDGHWKVAAVKHKGQGCVAS